MMKITGLSHLFKWENLHNWWLTKYFFSPLYIYAFSQAQSDGGTSRLPRHCGCPASNWPCGWDTCPHRHPIIARPGLDNTYEHDNINDPFKSKRSQTAS